MTLVQRPRALRASALVFQTPLGWVVPSFVLTMFALRAKPEPGARWAAELLVLGTSFGGSLRLLLGVLVRLSPVEPASLVLGPSAFGQAPLTLWLVPPSLTAALCPAPG